MKQNEVGERDARRWANYARVHFSWLQALVELSRKRGTVRRGPWSGECTMAVEKRVTRGSGEYGEEIAMNLVLSVSEQ